MRTLLHRKVDLNRAIDHPPPVRVWLKGEAVVAVAGAAADTGVPVLVDPAGSVYVLTAELLYLIQQVFPAI